MYIYICVCVCVCVCVRVYVYIPLLKQFSNVFHTKTKITFKRQK